MKNEESAAADLQQTCISANATSTTGHETTLVFDDQGRGEKGQQGAAEQRRERAGEGEGTNHGMHCK